MSDRATPAELADSANRLRAMATEAQQIARSGHWLAATASAKSAPAAESLRKLADEVEAAAGAALARERRFS